MSHNARDQKKLAKKKAKRQEKRTIIAKQTSKDPTVRLAPAEAWPVLDAFVAEGFWESGIGIVLLSRRLPDGGIVIASLVVDAFCLGVKDCYWKIMSTFEYQELLLGYRRNLPLAPVRPEYLVKLVTEAVAYARSFSFPPHADYRHVRMLFAGIDPAQCTETFVFGKDGKPLYIQGPHESPSQVHSIMRRIASADGNFVVGMRGGPDSLEIQARPGVPQVEDGSTGRREM